MRILKGSSGRERQATEVIDDCNFKSFSVAVYSDTSDRIYRIQGRYLISFSVQMHDLE